MGLLEKVNYPKDLKKLSTKQLNVLSREIRNFLLEKVSKTGGHLASNLGVVELSIALHKFLDCPKDSLIWDVGHQCYVHKILTGRKKGFDQLRQKGGMSGFPDPKESEYDLFKTGHASTSISIAMGIAEANLRMRKKSKVVAVIGDGSFTGGLTLEAINQIGYLGTPVTIIMNDNRMSIAENVGALSRYTKRIEKTKTYRDVKNLLDQVKENCHPDDKECIRRISKLRKLFKKVGTPGLLFEKLGINYIGPVDGHSFSGLEKVLKEGEKVTGPVLIHVRTKKGMGYGFAEDRADKFHGVSPFVVENGNSKKCSKEKSYTDVFGDQLLKMAKKNDRIVGITAAMSSGTGLNKLANELPSQFFDVGICEGHAVTFAAGMAKSGYRPVVAIYSTFLQRSLDQIIHDVCLQKLPVIFAIDRAGLVGEDGPTHHGVFDVSFLRFIPNIVLMAPKDGNELEMMLSYALRIKKPVAIRYPRGCIDDNLIEDVKHEQITIGKAEYLLKGRDKIVVFYGNHLARALKIVGGKKDFSIVNARFAKPIDNRLIKMIGRAKEATIIEENAKAGGFASGILEKLIAQKINTKIKIIGIEDSFVDHGNVDGLRKKYLV
ncbi:MAG: 1-deoxy-D-xylulose-5-phosphate synthase [Patescibacteria group bacterium]|nr:1-deoxy-D-xylulose-5-phosphate synthase [Patescibacteria group bacterium]